MSAGGGGGVWQERQLTLSCVDVSNCRQRGKQSIAKQSKAKQVLQAEREGRRGASQPIQQGAYRQHELSPQSPFCPRCTLLPS